MDDGDDFGNDDNDDTDDNDETYDNNDTDKMMTLVRMRATCVLCNWVSGGFQ